MTRPENLDPPKVSVTGPAEEEITMDKEENSVVEMAEIPSPDDSSKQGEQFGGHGEEVFHKKFDKFRRPGVQFGGGNNEETRKMESLTINDDSNDCESMMVDNEGQSETRDLSTGGEKVKKSATETHPQLLAQLKSGPQFKTTIHPAFPTAAGPQFTGVGHQPVAGLSPSAMNTSHSSLKPAGSISPNNVVLTVPQTPFISHSPPSNAGSSSLMSNHPCLQTILHSPPDSHSLHNSSNNYYLKNEQSNGALPIKNEFSKRCLSSDSLSSLSKQSENSAPHLSLSQHQFSNGHSLGHGHYPNVSAAYGNIGAGSGACQGAMGAQEGATGAAQSPPGLLGHHYLAYQQMLMQHQGARMSHFNEHLAGMQHMVYGGADQQQMRR